MATFLTARWQNLIMANYCVNASVLTPYLPAKTRLDFFNGHCYLSLVGFLFADTRLRGIKIPFHVNFEEVNLRFYVRHQEETVDRRGVVFIKEIVPKPAISLVANTLYREKYCTKKMRHTWKENGDTLAIAYQWKHAGVWNSLQALVAASPLAMNPGSEEEFIAEHYWGYSRYDARTSFEYEVQHPRWELLPVKEFAIQCDFGALYGDSFAFLQQEQPHSVFVAKGSEVAVLGKRKL